MIAVPAAVCAAALVLAGPASAATCSPDLGAAATWLAGPALTDGNHVVYGDPASEYQGQTADALFALVAAGGQADTVAAMDAYLAASVATYADPNGTGQYPGPYSGALAKLSLVAEVRGENPHAYGTFDLLKVLVDNECTAATSDGTCTAPGEFYQAYSPISQALGVLALQRSPVAADHLTAGAAPVQRLLALRCSDGGFSGSLLAPGTPCATGDVDTSAYVAQALAAVPGRTAEADVAGALTFLAGAQDTTGGFAGASGVNANSTGVALSAFSLAASGYAPQVTAATAFLGTLQRPDGAVQVNAATPDDDPAKDATAQALLGLTGRSLTTLVPGAPVPSTPSTCTSAEPTTAEPTTSSPASPSGSPSATPSGTGTTGYDTAYPAPTSTGPLLAVTGAANGHLGDELAVALGAVAAGGVLVWAGTRRGRAARHRG